jgi:trimeric autotransporter adhesin
VTSWLLLTLASRWALSSDQYGQVTFSDLPVPGATLTATRGDVSRVTVTDARGVFHFADLADGPWTMQVEMLGFSTLRQEIVISADAPPVVFALTVLPFEAIASGGGAQRVAATAPAAALPARTQSPGGQSQPPAPSSGFQRATVNVSPASAADAVIAGGSGADADRSGDAADGFLINGSVNNGAASPFAQLAAFGNNRRNARSLFNGGLGVLIGNSAWAAAPYSFTDRPARKPDYNDVQIAGSFAGPLKVPGLRNRVNFFGGYQHTADHNATTQSGLLPTSAERRGDFSRSVDAFGRPVRPIDPSTGAPFPGSQIPQARITPQAAALLTYYPAPNVDDGGRYNYETPVLSSTDQDALQLRYIEAFNPRNQLFGNVSLQRTRTNAANLFGFVDATAVSGVDAPVNWTHRFSQFFTLRLRYQHTRLATHVTPYFANRDNVSGNAGIAGNNQDPVNWGPPALSFSSGIAGLAAAQYASNHDRTDAAGAEVIWNHGRHNVTAGGDLKRRRLDIVAQQNARGTFAFTGGATGSDLADFLLGLPHASTIAFGNADKLLRAASADAYVTDDMRLSPAFTANVGLRWEYEAPFTERFGRLVNLDVTPGFAGAAPVVARDPVGPLTGARYPSSLVQPDWRGIQPRLGIAWRPVAGSSLVVRGGYGIYRNSSVYQALTLLLAQQPPLSTTSSVETSAAHPLTLANGFVALPAGAGNTFAVDPDFRVGYAHNWQVLAQRDLPASLTITATYLGSKGSRLMQELLPNTYPSGAANPCAVCPAGFVYLTANGSSSRHAGQLLVRRRLHNGFTASMQYTLAKATDDAAAVFTGASLNGAAIVQDWLDPDAERAPSSFDQRHLVTAQAQYTSGVGVGGGALAGGVPGSLLKGWTVTSQLTVGSGLPLTPIVLTSVPGTGVTGTLRADYHPADDVPLDGYYANPAAFSIPAAGRWGNAGRNSIRGPMQFSMNASLGRSFLWGDRFTFDWRFDATNVLNRVTFSNVNTIVGSPQFGLPLQANTMRKLQSSLRWRF